MSTPFYVDLFYEDIGFTNDYSNVLQFNSKEEREAYFDNIAHYRMENTQFNNMNIEGNSVKIAFYDLQSVDLDEINYIRIATRLYGSSTTIDTLEYGFVIDYEVISSAEDCTVVEFVFEKDIWMNYQFNFTFKECNVERSHVDRWDNTKNVIYNTPTYDAIDSYMKKNKIIKNEKTASFNTDYQGSSTDKKYAICCIAYLFEANSPITGNAEESMQYIYFPVDVSNYLAEIKAHCAYYNSHELFIYYPSLQSILDGTYVSKMSLTPSRVKNAFIVFDTVMTNCITNWTLNIDNTSVPGKANIVSWTEQGFSNATLAYDKNKYLNQGVNTKCYGFVTTAPDRAYPWNMDKVVEIDISKPICPVNGDDYSDTHEPMMYKSPVMKRYISSFDGGTFMEIPDVKVRLGNRENVDKNYVHTKAFIDYTNAGVLAIINSSGDISIDNVMADSLFIPSINCDILNNAWDDYVNTTRGMDRQAMWLNIATGGMADTGSTAISAGIGYRSNMERAEMARIQRSTLDGRTKQARAMKKSEDMYARFARQAVGMSLGGGALQYGASAVGAYFGQEIKESAIKNTPGTLTKMGDLGSLIYTGVKSNLNYIELICDDVSKQKYADIFKKFGYAICGVITPNIKSRKFFNYIKTNGAILTGNVNQSILSNLAVLFDRGMTIWHMDCTTKNTLYKYDKENIERTLMVSDYNYTQIATIEDWDAAVSHLDIMEVGSRLRIAGTSGTDRLHTISWRNVDSDIWNLEGGNPVTSCDIHLDTAGTYEIYGRFKINGEYVNTETTRFKVIE